MTTLAAPPIPTGSAGFTALRALFKQRDFMAALQALHRELGDVFRITLPGFNPVVMVGPEANRFVLATGRHKFRWRNDADPVTALLRRGVLVVDGDEHALARRTMNPALHKRVLANYVGEMLTATDRVLAEWAAEKPLDMLVEMRKVALLILMQTMFDHDFQSAMQDLWPAILKNLRFISPGFWLIWPALPRPGYQRARQKLDAYLYQMIAQRRKHGGPDQDLLGLLMAAYEDNDDLIRDQLLTMLIAGHDTSTSLFTWVLNLLGQNPLCYERVREEIDTVLGRNVPSSENIQSLDYLDRVIKETLRLYPPIHLGSRLASQDLDFNGYHIPEGSRVIYSIYLTHRMEAYWQDPNSFDPDRFAPERKKVLPAYAYLPFGGGPRNCIGFAFTQVEAKVVLARVLQRFDLDLLSRKVRMHMGATLEPRPSVLMRVRPR